MLRPVHTAAADLKITEGELPRIVGYAALYDVLSEDLGGFRERIQPGAFSESLLHDDIRALFNHDANVVLGRNRAGTLALSEDERGLRIEITPPNTQSARDLLESISRGDITQMSFGFMVKPDGQAWSRDQEGRALRTLTAVNLFDVSPVVFPAYADTSVAVRALHDWRGGPVTTRWRFSVVGWNSRS